MSGGSATPLPPSIRGVVFGAIALALNVFVSCLFAYFGWRSLDADIAPLTLMMAGGWILALGGAWASVVRMLLAWEPSIPRARDGVLEVRFPRRYWRSLRFSSIGGAIFTVGGLMGIWVILTDEPVTRFRAGAVVFLVLFVMFLILLFIATFLSNRVRFRADSWGLQWDAPLPAASIRLAWDEIDRLSRRRGRIGAPRLVAVTNEGRKRVIAIPAVSLPASQEARATLFSEIEKIRPGHEPDRTLVDNRSVFERFNDEAREAMVAAQQVTRGVGHDEIGTAELLVVLATKTFVSGKVLVRLGLSPESVYEATDRVVAPGTVAHLTHRPMAKDLKKAILMAGKEADRLNESTIGTEHLLLGVLQDRKSVGGKVLKEMGVNYDAARDAILEVRAADLPLPPPPAPPATA